MTFIMRSVLNLPRPTFRCISNDLGQGWADSSHQRLVESGVMGSPALSALDHPLIRHVVDTFADLGEEVRKETISGLSDPKFYKAKSSRWRGAVYIDPDGQPWLVAAGLRREGERTDFYSEFCGDVHVNGPAKYLPTGEDLRRLRREHLDEQLGAWETKVHNDTLDALALTEGDLTAKWNLLSLDGTETIAEFTLRVEVLDADDSDPEGYGDITLEVSTTNWQQHELVEHAEIVVMCSIDPRESSWTPGHTTNRIYSICDSADQISAIIAAAQDPRNVHPKAVEPSQCAHYTHRERLTEQYIEGTPAKALCGRFFVPRQMPDGLPTCPACEGVYRSMQAATV
jgi:Protein of unknown function (DUF3039)